MAEHYAPKALAIDLREEAKVSSLLLITDDTARWLADQIDPPSDKSRDRLSDDLRSCARIMAETETFPSGQSVMIDAAVEIERLRSALTEIAGLDVTFCEDLAPAKARAALGETADPTA